MSLVPQSATFFQASSDHGDAAKVLRILGITYWLLVAFSQCLGSSSVLARDAQEVIDRADRLEDEHSAWNPEPIPIADFISPRVPFKDEYPIIETEPRIGGVVFWMDNRYAMVWAGGRKDPVTGVATPYLAVLDTDNGEILDYKPGRLICYRDNRLTFETGPNDERQRKRWSGAPGKEVEVPTFATETDEKARKYWVSDFDCENKQPDENIRRAEELFGRFVPEIPSDFGRPGEKILRRTYIPLLARHGFFSADGEKTSRVSWKDWNRYVGITWFKPNGEQHELDLSPASEIGAIEARHWAPFLGRYIFQGGVLFNNLPHGRISPTPTDLVYRLEDRRTHTVAFSPVDGSIVRFRRPRYLLERVNTQAVFATRAGLLWVGSPVGPETGYYLSRGEEVRRIFKHEAHKENTWVSPDGCKVMTYYDPNASSGPSRAGGQFGAVLDFSSSTGRGKKRMAIINFCKGE